MSVRQSLLAILAQGPCYGHQLRHEFDRRTGSVWPLNVGQIYNTLERLERDGFASRGATNSQGHVYWHITALGSAEVERWLTTPVETGPSGRDEVAVKLAIAATLPGADSAAVIAAQRIASQHRLDELRRLRASRDDTAPEGIAWSLVVESMIFSADAEVRWLEHVRSVLTQHPDHHLALELTAERPRRGRPARSESVALV